MKFSIVAATLAAGIVAGMTTLAHADDGEQSCGDVMLQSLAGDVYGHPERWRELSLGDFFTEGWDRSWVSPPNGDGGAPRQGWLNADDGVFYRLGIATFGWASSFGDHGDQYTGGTTFYFPLNQRFEFRLDIPMFVANKGTGTDMSISAGDFAVTPRFLLTETKNFTQSLDVTLRAPTGDEKNFQHVAAVSPVYNFWWNAWQGLVVRGGTGGFFPYNHIGTREVGARPAFLGDFAVGYYFTDHDLTPIGDLVFYAATNLAYLTNNAGPNTTTVTITPGFRTHLGDDFYLLGGIELPVTEPSPFDYQLLGGLMKVF